MPQNFRPIEVGGGGGAGIGVLKRKISLSEANYWIVKFPNILNIFL